MKKLQVGFFYIASLLILAPIQGKAQFMSDISHEKGILLHSIDSVYPQKTHIRWSIFKSEKEIVGVSFELGDYLYECSGINKITYKEYDIDSIKIGRNILHKFDSLYVGDEEERWYQIREDTLLEVVYDSVDLLTFFDKLGNIVAKGKTIELSSAPSEISKYLENNCPGYTTLGFADKVTTSNNKVQYWLTPAKRNIFLKVLEYYELVFDKNGKIISQKHYGPSSK